LKILPKKSKKFFLLKNSIFEQKIFKFFGKIFKFFLSPHIPFFADMFVA